MWIQQFNHQNSGWYCHDIEIKNSIIQSEYIFLNSSRVFIERLKFQGKYSFQYMHDVEIKDSYLDTKDAFGIVRM